MMHTSDIAADGTARPLPPNPMFANGGDVATARSEGAALGPRLGGQPEHRSETPSSADAERASSATAIAAAAGRAWGAFHAELRAALGRQSVVDTDRAGGASTGSSELASARLRAALVPPAAGRKALEKVPRTAIPLAPAAAAVALGAKQPGPPARSSGSGSGGSGGPEGREWAAGGAGPACLAPADPPQAAAPAAVRGAGRTAAGPRRAAGARA